MADTMLFDDTYHGARWRYGLTLRPLALGTVPDGWIVQSDRPHPDYRFGTIDYPREITGRVAEQFSLVLVKHLKGRPARVPIDPTPIAVGMTVVRKADRGKPKPIVGTVERIIPGGLYYPPDRAVVAWRDNVRYLNGRNDQHSKVQTKSLMRWAPGESA